MLKIIAIKIVLMAMTVVLVINLHGDTATTATTTTTPTIIIMREMMTMLSKLILTATFFSPVHIYTTIYILPYA